MVVPNYLFEALYCGECAVFCLPWNPEHVQNTSHSRHLTYMSSFVISRPQVPVA